MGWLNNRIRSEHVVTGTVLGQDGKALTNGSGEAVPLEALFDEAVDRAVSMVATHNPELPPRERLALADQIGIGAVRYAGLSISRRSDNVFDLDRMLSPSGNTSIYIQYAHARAASILRRASGQQATIDRTVVMEPSERALMLRLDSMGPAVWISMEKREPHRLCQYLYELARDFTRFYEACPVLDSGDPARGNRLALCELAARTLRLGLELLGIAAPENMSVKQLGDPE
jgi:arginyl-tRNA synthetase